MPSRASAHTLRVGGVEDVVSRRQGGTVAGQAVVADITATAGGAPTLKGPSTTGAGSHRVGIVSESGQGKCVAARSGRVSEGEVECASS